jgi:hypothetical protein
MWGWGKNEKKEETHQPEFDSFDTDFNGIGIVDESQIVVSESDLNDPHLLSELNNLNLQNDDDDLISFDVNEEDDRFIQEKDHEHLKVCSQPDLITLKQKALALKKEGRKSEALALLKEAKNIQNATDSAKQITESMVQIPLKDSSALKSSMDADVSREKNVMTSSASSRRQRPNQEEKIISSTSQVIHEKESMLPMMSEISQFHSDPFTPFENAINEAMKSLLLEAKEFKDTNPQKAAEKFRKYKSLKDELLVVASRRAIPGALPPLFRWNTVSKETTVQDPSLGDDQLKVVIGSINDLEAVLQEHSSRTLSLCYNIGVIKDNPEYKTKQIRYRTSEKSAEFHEESIFTFRRKGSTVESQFSRKKANFTLVLHRGMFQSDKILGVAKLNLSELLTKCKTGGFLQLLDPSGKKAIGGRLEVYIMLRRPISQPEVIVETERELVIQEWPSAVKIHQCPVPDSSAPSAQFIAPVKDLPSSTPPQQQSNIDFSQLTELERSDPLNINLIVSNDVLESEITSTESSISSCRDPDELGDLQIKLMLLQGKLAVLVNQVQNESLSLEDYINSVKERLESDKRLAVYCNQNNQREMAVQLMKRIRIMQNEISSVEQAAQEESQAS